MIRFSGNVADYLGKSWITGCERGEMSYEEHWHNSLNRYIAIMDTRTDDIPEIVDEVVKPFEPNDPECNIELVIRGEENG